jgi:polysaccharide biosynthesis transport protein
MSVKISGRGIDIREYGKTLFKRRWTIAAFFFIVVATVTLGSVLQTSVFSAQTTLQILPEAPNVVSFKEVIALGSSNYGVLKDYYETQFRIIRSRPVAAEVLDKLNLREKAPYMGKDDPEGLLMDQIHVEPIKNSQLVSIRVEHQDPQLAAELANTVALVFQSQNLGRFADASKQALKWLDGEGGEMKKKLQESEKKLHFFMKKNQIYSFDEKYNIALQDLAKFSEAMAEARRKRLVYETLYSHAELLRKSGKAMKIPSVNGNKLILDLKSDLVSAEKKVAELLFKKKEMHPEVQEQKKQIAYLKTKIDYEIDIIVGSLRAEFLLAKAQEKEMAKAVESSLLKAQDVSEKETDYKVLKREADALNILWKELQKRTKETEITENSTANNIIILEKARVPKYHIRPKRRINVMLGALLGLIGGLGLAFLLEYLDNTIRTKEDIDQITDAPFLGIVPNFDGETENDPKDLFTHHHPKSSITESCRSIRTNILYSSPGKEIKKLLVTSAGPQEGKSTSVINLGIVFAQGGRRVCLVDSDLRRPRLHSAFNVERERGLTNLVVGKLALSDVIVSTLVPGVDLLPSGPIPPNPSELLGSERMLEVIDELQRQYDLVIFDSPPIVAVTDATVMSRSVDGVIVIVKAGRTTTDILGHAVKQIEDVGSNVMGTILNDFNIANDGYRYYYQYHYYRGEDNYGDSGRRGKKDDLSDNAKEI